MGLPAGPLPTAASPRRVAFLFVVAIGVLSLAATMTLESGVRLSKYQAAVEGFESGSLPRARMLDFSPLYLALSAAAARLTGAPADAMLVLQILLAAASVALVFVLLARRVSPRVAVLGAAMMLTCRSLLVYQTVLEPEVLLLFLIVLFLVLVSRPQRWATLAAGVVAGLALATRPNLLPVLAVVPVAFALEAQPRRWRQAASRSLVFALPIAATLGFLMVRSAFIAGDPLAPTMNPGTVFFEGNQPLSLGTSAAYPPSVLALTEASADSSEPDPAHRHYREVAAASTAGPPGVRVTNAFWQGHALAFIRSEPGRWLGRLLGKLTLAFHQRPLHDTVAAWAADRALRLPTLPFAALAGLALVGLLLEARNLRSSLLYYALIASQLAVMLVFYVSARQRLALVPGLVYFASVAVQRVGRPGGVRPALVAGLLAICLLVPQPVIEEADAEFARTLASRGLAASLREQVRRDGVAPHQARVLTWLATRPQVAERQRPAFLPQDGLPFAQQILATLISRGAPQTASDRFDRALALAAAGSLETADRILTELMDEGFAPYRPAQPIAVEHYRARIAFARGDTVAGTRWLRRALEVSPGDPFSLAMLVARAADEPARTRLAAYWSRVDGDWLLGRAYLEAGQPATAVDHLERVVRVLPALRDAQIDLAAALAATGRDDEAALRFLDANRKGRDPVLQDPAIPELFRRWHAASPSADRRFATIQVLHTYGHMGEALELIGPLEAAAEARSGGATALDRAVREEALRLRRAIASMTR